MVAQGSVPWALVCFIILLLITLVRYMSLRISLSGKEEKVMKLTIHRIKLFALSLTETIWIIATNTAAGALPA